MTETETEHTVPTDDEENGDLEQLLAAAFDAARLVEDEQATVREIIADGTTLEDAITSVLASRETEDEQPQQAAVIHDEKWWDAADGKSDRENERHRKRVEEIYEGEAEEFTECPMCLGHPAGVLKYLIFPDEQRDAIMAALGLSEQENYKPMDGAALCDKCDGYGRVTTPSKVPGEHVKLCPACTQLGPDGIPFATGWRKIPGPNDPPQANVYQLATPAPGAPVWTPADGTYTPPPAPEPPAYDAWNRPAGHPHFNIPPADVGV